MWKVFASVSYALYRYIHRRGIRGNKEVKNKKRQIRFVRDNLANLIKNMSVLLIKNN